MTDSSGPFEGPSGPWGEANWYDFAPTWAPSGVIGAPAASATSGELAFSSSGLNVSAGPGKAWVRGAGFKRTGTPPTHAATANAHASFFRRDRLVLRRDLANNQVVTAVIQGTPQATPTPPALTQVEAGVWEEKLFSFLVPPSNGTTISGLVDERSWVAPWDGVDKATQAMISLNASQPLGVTDNLYQMQKSDWDSVVDHGRGYLTLLDNGSIRCERAGSIRVDAFAVSDGSDAGWSWLAVGLPFGGGNHLGGLDDRRARATGYPGAGALRQPVSAGPIVVQAGDLFSYSLAQRNTANAAVTYQCYLAVTYV